MQKYANLYNQGKKDVRPGGNSCLNTFRRIEVYGFLAKNVFKKYSFKLDSSYIFNGREVYRVSFEYNKNKGSIDIFSDKMHIKNINMSGAIIFSFALNERVRGRANVNFVYFNNQPYLSSIMTYYKKGKLEYYNNLLVLMQKTKGFKYSKSEYWAISGSEDNPFIKYYPAKWKSYKIGNLNRKQIEKDLATEGISLEQQFKNNANKYFVDKPDNEDLRSNSDAEKFIKKLEKLF